MEDGQGPTWGPLSQEDCVKNEPQRRYSATLHGGSSNACAGPFKNVMGAHFKQPSDCAAEVGYWHVYDSTCTAQMPTLPGPKAGAAPTTPAEGYADLHNHLLAHVAFGESVLWGASFGEPAEVLTPIPEHLKGPHQRVEALTSSRSVTGLFGSHEEDGHPTYQAWPTPHLKTHQQSHVDWLYRAYQGGLRLVVVHAVNNQDMFDRGENRLSFWLKPVLALFGSDATPLPHRTSNDMEALEHQIRAAHQLVAWVKQHRGGWLEIAQTPEQASQLIANGKMALILGSEVDHQLNCDLGRRCSEAHIQEGLTKLEAMGLAVLFPTHHKETQFGDAANFQPLNTGPLRPCPAFKEDCAAIGLTAKGRFLIREMMARGLLTDLGHAGDRPFSDTMALLEPFQYPTLMSHASAHPLRPNGTAEYTLTYAQLQQINQVGGMASLHSTQGEYAGIDNLGAGMPFASTDGGGGYIHSYLYTRDALGDGYFDRSDLALGGQIAFAADWNGFAGWPYGRFGNQAKPLRIHQATEQPLIQPPPLQYPLELPPNLVPAAIGSQTALSMMKLGDVEFDFNKRGLAQAGMSPDLLADMRLHGLSEADLDPLYRSARGFVELWRRARAITADQDRGWLRWLAQSPTDLIDFEHLDHARLVQVTDGVTICRHRSNKSIGYLTKGECKLISSDEEDTNADSPIQGELSNANSGLCLDRVNTTELQQTLCSDTPSQQWVFTPNSVDSQRGSLRSPTEDQCVTAARDRIVSAACDDSSTLTLERIGNTYRILTADNRCAHVQDRRLDAGAPVQVNDCPPPGRADFHWSFNALRDARDYEHLFSTKALADSVVWADSASPEFSHLITTTDNIPLCRSEARLGLVRGSRCQLSTGDNFSTYKKLWSNTPLIH